MIDQQDKKVNFEPRIEGNRKLIIDPDTLKLEILYSSKSTFDSYSQVLEYDCENIEEAKHLYNTIFSLNYDGIDYDKKFPNEYMMSLDAFLNDAKEIRHMHNFYDATNAKEIEYAFLKIEKLLGEQTAIGCLYKYIDEKPEFALKALSGLESTNLAAKEIRERFNGRGLDPERTLESFIKIKDKKQLVETKKPHDEQIKELEKKYKNTKELLAYANTLHINQTKELKELREEIQELKASITEKAFEHAKQEIDLIRKRYGDREEHLQNELEAAKNANIGLKNLDTQASTINNAEDMQEVYKAIDAQEKPNIKPSVQILKETFEKATKVNIGSFLNKKEVYTFTLDEAQKLINAVEQNDKQTKNAFEKMTDNLKAIVKAAIKSTLEPKHNDSSLKAPAHEIREKTQTQQKAQQKSSSIGR